MALTFGVLMCSRRSAAAVVVVAATVLLGGCAMSSPFPAGGCVPRIFVEPKVTTPGDTIVVTSDTACDDTPPEGGWVVIAAHIGGGKALAHTTTQEGFDGSFRVTLQLPSDFPVGQAFAGIENWDYSFCSANASCASATGDFTVRR
jgi:hypothetical protein